MKSTHDTPKPEKNHVLGTLQKWTSQKFFAPPPSGGSSKFVAPPFHMVRFRCPPSPLSLPQPMNNEASLRPYGFCDFPFLFAMNLDLNILVCKNLCMEGNFLTTNWWHLTKYLGHYHFIFVIWRFLFAINNLDLQEKSEREIFDNYFGKFDKNLYPFISSLAFSHILVAVNILVDEIDVAYSERI